MSVEEELAEASNVIADYRERCAALEQLVKDYDAMCRRIIPFTYWNDKGAQDLRQRTRDQAIDIKEGVQ